MTQDFSLFLILITALFLNGAAYFTRFYHLPAYDPKKVLPIQVKEIFMVFAIYLILSMIFAPTIAKWIIHHVKEHGHKKMIILSLSGVQCAVLLVVLALTWGYLKKKVSFVNRMIKDSYEKSRIYDFLVGGYAWLISFPIVIIVEYLVDTLIFRIFGPHPYEQTAVHFVRLTKESPLALWFAIIAAVILAPILEELLFRGLLQNYFKRYLGRAKGIVLTALFFALFHLTARQGFGNIPLASAIFVLGIYLGFVYERQSSLYASLGLHVTFNGMSILRILFLPEN
ncbi:MAG: CPBP family intramembrane metalloprotease [Chlamydiae bacterium]|nr:CPBP family intramembrane metalloprotease [Chlamydiota bacterium]